MYNKNVCEESSEGESMKNKVYIFGAGNNGNELFSILSRSAQTQVVAFIETIKVNGGGVMD